MSKRSRFLSSLLAAFLAVSFALPPRAEATEVCPEFLSDVCFEDESTFLGFAALDGLWQRAGSSALPDVESLAWFEAHGSEARLRQGGRSEVLLRYPVVCQGSPASPSVTIEYQDDGMDARVRVKLVAKYLFNSRPKTIYAFDSDERPSGSRLQTWVARIRPNDANAPALHCGSAAYYFEVRLEGGAAGDPRLSLLGLHASGLVVP